MAFLFTCQTRLLVISSRRVEDSSAALSEGLVRPQACTQRTCNLRTAGIKALHRGDTAHQKVPDPSLPWASCGREMAAKYPDAADFACSAVLAFANALSGGVAFNFALRRLTSETTVASARS